MTDSHTVVAQGSFSAMRELERVLKPHRLGTRIVAPPGCKPDS